MSYRADRVTFTQGLATLLIEMYSRGYEPALAFCKRCEDCPVGKPHSKHKKCLAADIDLYDDLDGDGENDDWCKDTEHHRIFGEMWERMHPRFRWGGRYNDGNHYEMLDEGEVRDAVA